MTQLKSPIIWRLFLWLLIFSLIPLGVVEIFVQQDVQASILAVHSRELDVQAKLLLSRITDQPNQMQEIVQKAATANRTVLVLGQDGAYLAHSDPAKVGQKAGSDLNAETLDQILAKPGTVINLEESQQMIDSIRLDKGNLTIVIIENIAETANARAALSRKVTNRLIFSLILMALAGGGAVITVLNPLTRLSVFADRLSAGELDAQLDTSELEGEIVTLATSLTTLAKAVKTSIATLEQRVAARTRALAISTEISRRLSTILDQKELVSEVVNQVNNAFGYYHTQFYFYDEAGENLVMAGGTGKAGEMMLAQFHKVAKGHGLVGRSAERNEPILVSDISQNPEWLSNPVLPDTQSEMAIPISSGERVLGVLDIQHNVTNGLQQEDVDSLQSIANQVAVAIQNIRQYERTQKIAADMSAVAEVGIATSNITDSGRLLQEVVDLSKKSFNLYHAHIYLLNEAGDFLELASGAGEVGRQMVAEKRRIPFDSEQSLVARAARTQKGVTINDVTAALDFLPNPLLPNTRSEMAVPMIAAGRVIGVLDVQSETANRFTDVDVSIQTTLASQAAVALQNAHSFTQTQRHAQRETSVNLITQKIQGAATIEKALQTAARELGHALGMKQTRVALDPSAARADKK